MINRQVSSIDDRSKEVIKLLQIQYEAYAEVKPYADKYKHPHPTDTRGWSQLIVSALTGIPGIERKKGPDLVDGSDVKAANCWDAIDTPRFNGCIKAGTKASTANSLKSLDETPYLFFVLWDSEENTGQKRCRIWIVRTKYDIEFRRIAKMWYEQRVLGEITSNNFQLHPPRNINSNVFRNNCGHLVYPLLFEARLQGNAFVLYFFDNEILNSGSCTRPSD